MDLTHSWIKFMSYHNPGALLNKWVGFYINWIHSFIIPLSFNEEVADTLWCETDGTIGVLIGEYASKKTKWFKENFFFQTLKPECRSTGTVGTCSAPSSFSPTIPSLAAGAPGSWKWGQKFHQFHSSRLSYGKTSRSLLYIYLYLPSNRHFNLDTTTHNPVFF